MNEYNKPRYSLEYKELFDFLVQNYIEYNYNETGIIEIIDKDYYHDINIFLQKISNFSEKFIGKFRIITIFIDSIEKPKYELFEEMFNYLNQPTLEEYKK